MSGQSGAEVVPDPPEETKTDLQPSYPDRAQSRLISEAKLSQTVHTQEENKDGKPGSVLCIGHPSRKGACP